MNTAVGVLARALLLTFVTDKDAREIAAAKYIRNVGIMSMTSV